MVKVVYNDCKGGFELSQEASDLYEKYRESKIEPTSYVFAVGNEILKEISVREPKRTDPLLVKVIEELGEKANTSSSFLRIDEIPDEYADCYTIEQFYGMESIRCNKYRLIEHRLATCKPESMNKNELVETLKSMKEILNQC